jgi:hypothetical protein
MRQQSYPHAGPPNGYQNGYQYGYQNGYNNGESPVSTHSYNQSYDAMTSGSEEYNKSTNPSSQNSSFDQLQQFRNKPDEYMQDSPYAKEIHFNQTSPAQLMPAYDTGDYSYGQKVTPTAGSTKGYNPPAVNNPRQPIQLNGVSHGQITPPTSPKKQSWIKRRFSKRAS